MPTTTKGYDLEFLGAHLPFPKLPTAECALLKRGTGNEIQYIHYSSSFLHKGRLLPLMTACNIKGEAYNAPVRDDGEPWDFSEQVNNELQLGGSFYGNDFNTFDRGHIVRRVDPCRGDDDTVAAAELGTFHWTNCTLQHKKLNQKGGAWYELEQFVMEAGVKNKIADISVMAGPVLAKNDKALVETKGKYKDKYIQIPTEFWKLIVWKKEDGKLYAVTFLMSQWEFIKDKVVDMPAPLRAQAKKMAAKPPLVDDYFETLKFRNHKTYQVPVSAIEQKTGIKFNWTNVNFPYQTQKAKVVKGTPVKKHFTFATIENKRKRIKATTGVHSSRTAVKERVLIEDQPLSATQVAKAIKKGYAAAIKRCNLSNITF